MRRFIFLGMFLFVISVCFSGCGFSTLSSKHTANEPEEPYQNLFGLSHFARIPAGSFQMGSENGNEDERPVHDVCISKDFYLGKYEVTQKQWKEVMGYNPSFFKGENRPVENISWRDIKQFLEKINETYGKERFRLPTEAEWEYACRGGTTTPYYTGETLKINQANFKGQKEGTKFKETLAVGSYPPNAFGLYDMHGNVWEWCVDRYKNDYYKRSPRIDPKCPVFFLDAAQVYRGGSWLSSGRSCRSSHRFFDTPFYRRLDLGFRLVRLP